MAHSCPQCGAVVELPPERISDRCAFCENVEGAPVLLPIYIGAYRRKDEFHRVVLNGQTGAITGDVPLSVWRVLAAVLVVLALLTVGILVASAYL